MRKLIGILILQFLVGTYFAKAAHNKFFIAMNANNKEAASYLPYFESQVAKALLKNFPCANIISQSDIAALLDLERQKQLLGTGNENALSNMADAMGCDYLISLDVRVMQGTAIINSFCSNRRRVKTIMRAVASAPCGDAAIDALEKVSNQLIDGFKNIEICPFTGPVTININSEMDSTNTVDYGVYCNESDQQFHQEMMIHDNTVSDWKLQRKDVYRTEGTMTFNLSEESKVTEENGCYKCKSGREGGRTSTETRSIKVNGSGISHESTFEGKPQDDTRIELKFLENGTYLVIAKGTSQPATSIVKVVTKAEGTCDNQPQQTKTESLKKTIPLNQIFGPYEGKATDKVLQQKDSKETVDPITREKTTVTFDFTLKQKEK